MGSAKSGAFTPQTQVRFKTKRNGQAWKEVARLQRLMKKDSMTNYLLAVACAMTAMVCLLGVYYEKHFRKLRKMEPQVRAVQMQKNSFSLLLGDLVEYGKRNPTIDPLLKPLGINVESNSKTSK
jgi:hypothetical protein